jgi:glycine/D-amino acid oxidase-like deaminating enzyme
MRRAPAGLPMKRETLPVLIAGAGLLGSCIALELARRRIQVVLLDQDSQPMNRSSLRNEGKIHLGLIYANDSTFETARLQLSGALRFRRLLQRWIGAEAGKLRTSTSFTYLVARDSLLEPDRLARHYARVEEEYHAQCSSDPKLDYLGKRPPKLTERLPTIPPEFAADFLQAAFATPELAIDTDQLAQLIRRRVRASSLIDFRGDHCIRSIEKGDVLHVEGDGPNGNFVIAADQVVNVTWERRAALDRRIGMAPSPALLHRLKFRVLVRVPPKMKRGPSATMVLGRYGDVVIRPSGLSYLSWYPTGMRGWTSAIEPPREWDEACRGNPKAGIAREVGALALRHIDRWYPGIAKSRIALVDAGAIVALGRTDVDDAASGLHHRVNIGVISLENYHTIDPGKMTTAPLFALEAAERVATRAGQRGARKRDGS